MKPFARRRGEWASIGSALAAAWPPPTPSVRAKKARGRLTRPAADHLDWLLGHGDEVWLPRLAPPTLRTRTGVKPSRTEGLTAEINDPDLKALACYRLLCGDREPAQKTADARGD